VRHEHLTIRFSEMTRFRATKGACNFTAEIGRILKWTEERRDRHDYVTAKSLNDAMFTDCWLNLRR
jgi:hypothetical protein